jgi:hypothetical protein
MLEPATIVVLLTFLVLLMAFLGVVVSVFFSRRGDCEYARAIFNHFIEYRTVAGPGLVQDELRAFDHALIDSRDPAFVLQLLETMPTIGDRASLHFMEQCARGTGVSAPAANVPEVREAARISVEKLRARLDDEHKSSSMLRAVEKTDENLLRPAISVLEEDKDRLLRPQDNLRR